MTPPLLDLHVAVNFVMGEPWFAPATYVTMIGPVVGSVVEPGRADTLPGLAGGGITTVVVVVDDVVDVDVDVVDVLVDVDEVVVVVGSPGESGRMIARNCWSPVADALFART